ncbi:GNAT family N-acetyltransferase [Mobilicoccus massiliensis]|uniref:GNAT family N-acetyltransferase n=1 Tax=Mobilicoccus massiliensis TaxID=1522310 RepID=UPI0009E5B581|nr:GNAT family N-acetyltransferase [Mobilicoccus massiliensis]
MTSQVPPFPACVPELTDGRVQLRAHRDDDIPAIVEQCVDPESVRWTTVPRPYGADDARQFLDLVRQGWDDPKGQRYWAIEWTDDDVRARFGGTIDLRPRGSGGAEIGFGLHPDARGQHVMSTAVRLACRWWFANEGRRVTWWANVGNTASWRVAWACGFTWHGTVPEYLPLPDGTLADGWVASVGSDDDLTRPVEPWTHDPGTPVVADAEDTRDDGPMTGGERETLLHWLDLYRETVLLKIGGLDAEQLCRRSVPPSTMSLLGMVRHLTEVEAYWLREVLHGEDLPDYYCTRESPDGDFDDIDPARAAEDVAAYRDEVTRCREAIDAWPDLDVPGRGRRHGKEVALTWILTHLVEEYARHLGHMDLLRETIDGRTGY